MPDSYTLKIEQDILETINGFFKKLLQEKIVDALLIPQEVPSRSTVLQTLVRRDEEIKNADPFAPLLPMNSASIVSQLTCGEIKEKIGVVLRSCEIRATIELIKLKQVNLDNVIIIGVDCLGTYEADVFQELIGKNKDTATLTKMFLSKNGKETDSGKNGELRLACRSCVFPAPENADLSVGFIGCDVTKEVIIQVSEKLGEIQPEKLGLVASKDISGWKNAVDKERSKREKVRDAINQEVLSLSKDVQNFIKELEKCRRCYNCRRECPICYCRECVFASQTFEHSSQRYFDFSQKKGKIRMPTDTLLFHLTRMNHMVVSCVGCGQCTSACPNDIPIAKYFKTIGSKVQALFDYVPGRSVDEDIPQSTFKEEEFTDVGSASKK
jgi:formate dehydrogenase subunit beta